MTFSVMITTRNRAESLARTLAVLDKLNPKPFEILVTVDGSSDGTIEETLRKYPHVVLNVNALNKGSIASRHGMMMMARGEFVLALDDDSYPEQKDCLATLASLFETCPDLAVATFPQRTDEYPETLLKTDFGVERSVRSFASSGACLSVAAYRSLDGFQERFFHMYEEPDYALQCVAANWDIRFFPQITIRHHWVADSRSELRNHYRHARNEFWSTLMRCPMPYTPVILVARVYTQARFAAGRGAWWLLTEPKWWWMAMGGLNSFLKKRKPVPWQDYKRWLSLPDGARE
jgi:GT2 family glycosyltransferase